MSRPGPRDLGRTPLIALVHLANKALQTDMVVSAHRAGHEGIKQAHNAVFATLHETPQRTTDMAAAMGITRQSMGEIVRELVGLGILDMVPDPQDGRAKLVDYTEEGLRVAGDGFAHIRDLEQRFVEELGAEDYDTARRVLQRVTEMLDADAAGA